MRYFLLTACIFLSSLLNAHTQMSWGLTAGTQLSNAREDEDERMVTRNSLLRLRAGADFSYQLSEKWAIQSGLYYSGRGFRISIDKDFDTIRVRLNYVELPLLASYRMAMEGGKRLQFNGGIYLGYGFNGKVLFTGTPHRDYDPFKEKEYKRFNLGYMAETGFFLPSNIGIKAGYSHSLLNGALDGRKLKNFAFHFTLCFMRD